MEEMTSVLLQEIRGMREEMREFKDEVASWRQDHGERLVKVETVVKPALMTNGQPSLISQHEARISALEKAWVRATAIASAIVTGVTVMLHFLPLIVKH